MQFFFKVVGFVVLAVLGMKALVFFITLGDHKKIPQATRPSTATSIPAYKPFDELAALEDIAKLEELPSRTTDQLKKMRAAYFWLSQNKGEVRFYGRRAEELEALIAESEKADSEARQAALVAAKEASVPLSVRAMRSVTFELIKWERVGFGSVVEVAIYIKNESDVDIKDVSIYCEHYGNSGTKIDSSTRVIYDIVPRKGYQVFEKVNMGFVASQATSGKCKILDLKV